MITNESRHHKGHSFDLKLWWGRLIATQQQLGNAFTIPSQKMPPKWAIGKW